MYTRNIGKACERFYQWNVDLDLTHDGATAVKYVEDGNQYDLIILNIEMPGTFGHEAGARIRKLGYKGPIIGHTGHTDDDAKWYMIQGKMNAIISGVDLHEVMSAIQLV